MKLSAVFSSILAISAVSATDYSVPVTNDVGLVYTNMLCGTTPCSQTNLYGQPSYTAFMGNRDYRRILMSFSLADANIDPSSVSSCSLQFPQTADSVTWAVSPVAGYDAKTVTPATAPMMSNGAAQATGTGKVDITGACQNAVNGVVSVMVDAYGGPVTIPAGASMLMVDA
ncbi:hypothetical protein IWW56_003632 [Coemansia sp. RSA 2131]|nr:hypothetical protein IWW56_003632 [Coemansia sp. RSA 2131]